MDKLHITLIVILVAVLMFFAIPYLKVKEVQEVSKTETFKLNLTLDNVGQIIGLTRVYSSLTEGNDSNERICLEACGKQCVSLGYTYETSAFILENKSNFNKEIVNSLYADYKNQDYKTPVWCSCECNK